MPQHDHPRRHPLPPRSLRSKRRAKVSTARKRLTRLEISTSGRPLRLSPRPVIARSVSISGRRLILRATSLSPHGMPMTPFRFAPALLLALAPFAGTAYAADPEFKVALVTESREYERQQASGSIGGVQLPPKMQWTSRVTVALDGMRITGEWAPATSRSVS